MRAGDLDQVLALEVQLFGRGAWSYGMLAEELGGPGRWYVVATERDAATIGPEPVVGYAGSWFDGEVAQVMTIGVARRAQRRGVGATLLRALVGRAREVGADAVLLEVAVDNDGALALYERSGFVRIGMRKRYYQPEDTDAYTMRLALDAAATAPPPQG